MTKPSMKPDCSSLLTSDEVKRAVKKERGWLEENGAISAVTGGPVEDMEGVPLPADLHQGTPPTPHAKNCPVDPVEDKK